MVKKNKVLILPNKGNIPTMKDLEKKYDICEKICTFFFI